MTKIYSLDTDDFEKAAGSKLEIDYQKELNDQQYQAVSNIDGASMILAGAGSGKTRTLIYRVAYLLEHGYKPENLLLLTFTNKAAKEMLDRVASLLPFDINQIWGGTFHAIGNRILRTHAKEIGYQQNFTIMDSEDQKDIISSVIAESDIDTKEVRFPKPDLLANIFSLALNMGVDLEKIITSRFNYFAGLTEEIKKMRVAYQKKKKQNNCMDFDDLLALTVTLFKKNAEILQYYQRKFQFVLVDEYQDTNKIQAELVELLSQGHGRLMVVGDDAQSIYSWRGANFENIIKFPKKYPQAKTFKIETNYRSTPEILKLANETIKANQVQFEKNLQAHRPSRQLRPGLIPLSDPSTQAKFIAKRILELYDEGIEFKEMAVIYRSHFHSLDIQLEFANRNIPYHITSGLRFFEQAHIKDITSFIKLVVNPSDEVAFRRIVKMLPGIGIKTSQKLWLGWQEKFCQAGNDDWRWHEKPFSSVLAQFKVPAKAKKLWLDFSQTLDKLVQNDKNAPFIAPEKMLEIITESFYLDFMRSKFSNYENRLQDVEQLKIFSKEFPEIVDFLNQMSLLTGVDDGGGANDEEDDKVVLSTIHQAKGLEWRAVFLIWLTEGMFPTRRAVDQEDTEVMEEERRLFYVAVTRAKDELYLTYPQIWPNSWSGDMFQRPSRFLSDFPADLVESWEIKKNHSETLPF